jgi:hypothetical protein
MSTRPSHSVSNVVAAEHVVLMLLGEGQNLRWISRVSGWPARQIQLMGSRNGYLFTATGAAYKPPAFGEQPRRRT